MSRSASFVTERQHGARFADEGRAAPVMDTSPMDASMARRRSPNRKSDAFATVTNNLPANPPFFLALRVGVEPVA